MFGRWRRNDGFKWIAHVPTQIVMRRKARRERMKAAAESARDAAQAVARNSIEGIEKGAAKAGSAVVAGSGALAVNVGRQSQSAFAWLREIAGALGGAIAQRLAGLPIDTWQGAAVTALAVGGGLVALTGGILLALPAIVPAAATTSRAMLAAGLVAVLAALSPAAWRALGPSMASAALRVLKTQRASTEGTAAGRAGTVVVGVALMATVLAGGGWAAWKLTASIMGGGKVTGVARVMGVQSLRLGETELVLAGIAAPEPSQNCGEGGRKWRCGEDARRALVKLAGGKPLSCQMRGEDGAGHKLAQCFDGATDIAAALVTSGHVWADRSDAMGYRSLEVAAQTAKAGVWKAQSAPPWLYREKLWEEAQKQSPDGCPIKAQATSSQRSYHLPWDETYQRIRMGKGDIARGKKQWFCSETEAQAAGFKPALHLR